MRGFTSSTCLLFHIVILAVFTAVAAALSCVDLDENGDLLEQMKACRGETFRFKPPSKGCFDLSKLDQATADKILYRSNGEPKHFAGHVTIIGSALEKLILSTSADIDVIQEIKIIGNMKLNDLKLKIPSEIKASLTLKGNKELSMQSINSINDCNNIDSSTSKIQEFQECSFNDKALGSLADLQGCKRIYGDLIINQNTKIPDRAPTLRIKKIENGCVKIENSALKDSHFLDELFKNQMKCTAGKHVIKNNKDLCLSSEQREKWIAAGFELVYTGTCDDRCTVEYAIKNKEAAKAACDVVVGDVKITGDHRSRRQSGTPPKLAHWDRVKKLEGTLEVSGTNLENITIFNNLEKIANPSPEKVALTVMKNPKMTKFDLPKLANITMPANTWSEPIYFQDNENFTFTFPEGTRWERITGQSHLLIPMEPEPTTKGPPTTPRSTTLSPAEMKNKEAEEHNASVSSSRDWMLAAAIIGPPLIVISVALGVWCYWRRKNKKGKQTIADRDVFIPLPPVLKKARALIKKTEDKKEKKKGKKEKKIESKGKGRKKVGKKVEKGDLSLARVEQPDDIVLDEEPKDLMILNNAFILYRQITARCQMALDGEEIPFKMTDVIMNINAPELDIQRARNLLTQAPLSKMKYHGKPFRHIEKYKILFFNPKELNLEPVPYIEKYDRVTVFRYLVTHCSEFFVVNYHLLPDIIADCRKGAYYTPNNSLLAEIEGPVYVIGDIHGALHVLQIILNLDLDGEGKKHKIHPMFRNRYLFLGDYLDRGEHGLEVYFLLCIASRLFPDLFTVLRGNHDSDIADDIKADKDNATINTYGKRLKEKKKMDNPHHFADLMIIDMVTEITPYLPLAAIINGQTFASHGGFTLGMATTKKSVREIFKDIPVPYYEECTYKTLLGAHCNVANIYDVEEGKKDKYTERHETLLGEIDKWCKDSDEYTDNKKKNPNHPRNPDFELRFPGLSSIMWSDPGHGLASGGNERGCGCTYTIELVQKMVENNKATKNTRPIVDIIRAHQVVGIARHCDHRVTTVFTNCNNMQQTTDKIEDLNIPIEFALMFCSAILRLNGDGTQTVIMLAMTTEKEGDKALANPKRQIKRVFYVEKDEDQLEQERLEKEEKKAEKSIRVIRPKKGEKKEKVEQKEKSSQSNNTTK